MSMPRPELRLEAPLAIVEKDRGGESTDVHVVDRWCYLGSKRGVRVIELTA
jgi:hypothetical protein